MYLDYNATAPLSPKVIEWLRGGDFPIGNPSSLHASGRKAKKFLREARESILNYFPPNSYQLVFHSGATEGINTLVRSCLCPLKKDTTYFYTRTDHAAYLKTVEVLAKEGFRTKELKVGKSGGPDWDEVKEIFKKELEDDRCCYFNFLWANNETGVVWPIEKAEELKELSEKVFIHVDGVQAIGKVKITKLPEVNAMTFSGHKFGAFKGIGFSLLATNCPWRSFTGGGQEEGKRAGTENIMGIYSLKLALEDLQKRLDIDETRAYQKELIDSLRNNFSQFELVGETEKRASNIVPCFFRGKRGDTLAMNLDLHGVEVATSSACSSGSVGPNRVMTAMGYDKEESEGFLRISFSPLITRLEFDHLKSTLISSLKDIL